MAPSNPCRSPFGDEAGCGAHGTYQLAELYAVLLAFYGGVHVLRIASPMRLVCQSYKKHGILEWSKFFRVFPLHALC